MDVSFQYSIGFRNQENAPLDVQFNPNNLVKSDPYILAVINNEYLATLAELNSEGREPLFLMSKILFHI